MHLLLLFHSIPLDRIKSAYQCDVAGIASVASLEVEELDDVLQVALAILSGDPLDANPETLASTDVGLGPEHNRSHATPIVFVSPFNRN